MITVVGLIEYVKSASLARGFIAEGGSEGIPPLGIFGFDVCQDFIKAARAALHYFASFRDFYPFIEGSFWGRFVVVNLHVFTLKHAAQIPAPPKLGST
jgi:hypothetical protein